MAEEIKNDKKTINSNGRRMPPANAVKFQKGNPGGPGYPKGQPHFMTRLKKNGLCWKTPEMVRENLIRQFPEQAKQILKQTTEDSIDTRFTLALLSGESWAVKEYYERKFGKVKDQVESNITFNRGVDDLTDEQLDQRIIELQKRIGEGAGEKGNSTE